jgi:hypothetical protein
MNNFLKWTATVITLLGALFTSLQIMPLNIYLLNAASIFWLIWAIRINEKSLIAVNLGMLAVYAIGLFR